MNHIKITKPSLYLIMSFWESHEEEYVKGFVIQLLIKRCLFLMCLYHLEKYVESDVYFRKIDGISVTDLLSIKDLCFLREKVHVLTLVNVTLSIPLLPQDKNSNSNQNCAISLETSEATKGECKFSINPLHDFFFYLQCT